MRCKLSEGNFRDAISKLTRVEDAALKQMCRLYLLHVSICCFAGQNICFESALVKESNDEFRSD